MNKTNLNSLWFACKEEYEIYLHTSNKEIKENAIKFYEGYKQAGGKRIFKALEI